MALPYVLALLTFIAPAGPWRRKSQAASSDTQLAAFKPYLIADTVHTSLTKAQGNLESDEASTKAGDLPDCNGAGEFFRAHRGPGLVDWFGGLF